MGRREGTASRAHNWVGSNSNFLLKALETLIIILPVLFLHSCKHECKIPVNSTIAFLTYREKRFWSLVGKAVCDCAPSPSVELPQSWPGPQQSGRSRCTGGIPGAGKCQGRGETCQKLATLLGVADVAWAFQSSRDHPSAYKKQPGEPWWTEWAKTGKTFCGRVRGKGIVTLLAWEVSSVDGHRPCRRRLAMVATQ